MDKIATGSIRTETIINGDQLEPGERAQLRFLTQMMGAYLNSIPPKRMTFACRIGIHLPSVETAEPSRRLCPCQDYFWTDGHRFGN